MKAEEARIAAYGAVQAALATLQPSVQVEWDNRFQVDRSTQTEPFVLIDFVLGDGVQKSLGSVKVKRYIGQLAILIYVKEGSGISTALKILDHLTTIEMKNYGGLCMQASRPQAPIEDQGWHVRPLGVPFWFDDVVVG